MWPHPSITSQAQEQHPPIGLAVCSRRCPPCQGQVFPCWAAQDTQMAPEAVLCVRGSPWLQLGI